MTHNDIDSRLDALEEQLLSDGGGGSDTPLGGELSEADREWLDSALEDVPQEKLDKLDRLRAREDDRSKAPDSYRTGEAIDHDLSEADRFFLDLLFLEGGERDWAE